MENYDPMEYFSQEEDEIEFKNPFKAPFGKRKDMDCPSFFTTIR